MSDAKISPERIAQLSQKQLTLLALELQDQLAAEQRPDEPIAIVGMACRFPGGANSPDAFWQLLSEGRDAISEVPADRWDIDEFYDPDPDAPGKMSTRFGGFVDNIDMFDPDLFGISPREAVSMDPQQRVLLEVSWEALEGAGIAPSSLRGSRSGVFVGVCNNDYAQLLLRRDRTSIDAYTSSGAAFSVIAGRLAYTLGFEGAAVVLDTACSSSLVAIHEACEHLRSNRVSLALAGGVNVICAPDTTIALSKAHMMAPDGRCKTFDDSANGFVRAEGCGILVLKRLSDATAAGDDVVAVIHGTAVNQDGRSSGLTVPSGSAQVNVIQEALGVAGLQPGDMSYVEAHGTGTSLGDPIEVRALNEAYCGDRKLARPLLVGSVKTNIGHMESAAGIGGVMKAVLAIRHGKIPPHLHLKNRNQDVAWAGMPIEIPATLTEWPDDKRLAGVSSFGFSGTNAHVIVGDAPTAPGIGTVATAPAVLLPMSARTPAALDGLVEKWTEHLAADGQSECGDACFSAAVGRAHLRERAAVVAADGAELAGALERGELTTPGPARRAGVDVEPVFLFTGFGAQSVGMGMALYEHSPVYRQAIDACASVLDEHVDRPLLDVIGGETNGQDALVNQTRYGQPALFALEYALAMLWRSWGIEPAAAAGHSLGEIVAACVANVFSLEDALRFVAERSRLIGELPPGGGMAAVFAPADDVRSALQSMNSSLDIAAINGAANTVVSGDAAEIDALLETFKQRGIDSRRLVVSHAFHSSRLDPMVSALEAYVSGIAVRPPSIPLMSNLTGQEMRDAPDPHYWGRHAREAVRFQEGVQSLVARGYRWFIEIGPHPSLLPMVHENLSDGTGLLVPSLRRGVEEWSQLLEGLASLYVNGANIDWGAFYGVKKRQRRAVPTYSFDRRSFWLDTSSNTRRTAGTAVDLPLLDARLDVPVPTFRTVFDERSERFVFGHRVGGGAVVSAPIFAELAGEATANVSGIGDLEIRELSLTAPLELADGGQTELYTTVTEKPDATYDVRMFAARSNDEQSWIQHAAAIVAPASSVQSTRVSPLAPEELAANHTQHDPAEFYSGLAEMGIQLEHGLAGMSELWQDDDGNVVARIELDRDTLTPEIYRLHPAMADAAMQALGAAVSLRENGASSHMLAGIERIGTWRDGGRTAWARAVLRNQQTGNGSADGAGIADWVGDIVLYDDSREVIAAIEGVTLKHAALHPSTGDSAAWFYRLEWNQHVPNLPLTSFGVAGDLSPPDVVEQAAVGSLTDASAELSVYDEALPRLDQLAYHYISTAFSALALNDLAHFSLEEACKRAGSRIVTGD